MRKGVFSELPRQTLRLTFHGVFRGDYFDGKGHDRIEFNDDNGVEYLYHAPYGTKMAQELTFTESGKSLAISARIYDDGETKHLIMPRILNKIKE